MLQLNAVKHIKIGSKRRGDKNLPVEFISDHGTLALLISPEHAFSFKKIDYTVYKLMFNGDGNDVISTRPRLAQGVLWEELK